MQTDLTEWPNYRYVFEFVEMIIESPIANKALLRKIGYKYIIEGYLNVSKTAKNFITKEKYFADSENDLGNFIEKQKEDLKLFLPSKEDLNDMYNYQSKVNSILDINYDNRGQITQYIFFYDNELYSHQFDEILYVKLIFSLMISICSGGIAKKESDQRGLIELFLSTYLSRLAKIHGLSAPKQSKHEIGIYFYDEDRVILHAVQSLAEYINTILDVGASKERSNKTVFYRGHKSSSYTLIPSIFRDFKWRVQEKEMCNELERLSPKSFESCYSKLDRLVEMQHYELPTRLLDVTTNSLVALLFACDTENVEGEDGEVVLLSCLNKKVCYQNSDKVALLSAVSQMNYVEQMLLYYSASIFRECIINKRKMQDLIFNKLLSDLHLMILQVQDISTSEEPDIKELMDARIKLKDKTYKEIESLKTLLSYTNGQGYKVSDEEIVEILERFNCMTVVNRLIKQVQREVPSFESRILPIDLLNSLFIKPPLGNQRIVKQSGAFILCATVDNEHGSIMKKINELRYRKSDKTPIILIPSHCKSKILSELSICDLHTANIYPEIDKIAAFIKNNFKTRCL